MEFHKEVTLDHIKFKSFIKRVPVAVVHIMIFVWTGLPQGGDIGP